MEYLAKISVKWCRLTTQGGMTNIWALYHEWFFASDILLIDRLNILSLFGTRFYTYVKTWDWTELDLDWPRPVFHAFHVRLCTIGLDRKTAETLEEHSQTKPYEKSYWQYQFLKYLFEIMIFNICLIQIIFRKLSKKNIIFS